MNTNSSSAEDLFLAAIEIATPELQAAFLDRECAGDATLRARVENLLAKSRKAGALFGGDPEWAAPGSRAGTVLTPVMTEKPGERIGRYKLLQQIGEGGFGTVWMAEQVEPVTRRVALKIIKLGMDTREIITRFEAERQALAMMEHPNIAKVLDAGATDKGRPFFVMELVKGVPITHYCDEAGLGTRERLALFGDVCSAINHAHQKGVIHRDIKPSNVMVTLHSDKPVVKVIDFGIAKATQCKLTDKTLFTRFEQFIGTPVYMSPEQAALSAVDIDTRSDIYALGILLYELLTGTPPFDAKSLAAAGYEEMRRIIREEEPLKPSSRLSTLADDERTTLAKARHIEPGQLSRMVEPDLDWIVMKAIEKDRSRRYETANGLALDIERFLADEPVSATTPGAGYRFRKFTRRHKTALRVVAGIAAVLVAATGISTWQAVRATRAERAAGAASIRALTERDRARKAEQEANDQRQLAESARVEAEHNLYAATINLAQEAWEEANIGRLRGILEESRAYPHRGFEWYYWQTHLELRTLRGHERTVSSVAFSPNGRRIVTGSLDKTARVWDVETDRELFTLEGHTDAIASVAFSPDGRRILTGGDDNTARTWDAETGRERLALKGHAAPLSSAVYSPDGQRILTGSRDNTAKTWDAETGGELLTLKGHTSSIREAAFSPDGQRILTGSDDTTAKTWHAETGGELLTLKGHPAPVMAVAWSPEGGRILTGSQDNTARTWDAETGSELLAIKGHSSPVSSVAWSPDGQRVLTGSGDSTARTWDAETGSELLTLKGHLSRVASVAWSPDGRRILTGSQDRTAKTWDAEPGRDQLALKGHSEAVKSVAFSPDGRRVLTGSADKTARVWDVETGRELLSLTGHAEGVYAVAFPPNGRRILTGGADYRARTWDAETGRELLTFKGHNSWVVSVAFSPDSQRIVTGSLDATAKVWDAETGRELLTLKGPESMVSSVAFSPDGRRILMGCVRAASRVWDAETGRELLTLNDHASPPVAFSPDGRWILTGSKDNTARTWDAETGRELLTLKGHKSMVSSVAFSSDSRRILTGSADYTTKVWDADSGRELLTLKGHDSAVNSVAISSDGRRILTGSEDKTAMVWVAASPEEVEAWRKEEQPSVK